MNQTVNYDFTIIIPVFNEEESLPALEKNLSEYLNKSSKKTCVLLVDDGSSDKSLELIKDMCKRNDDFFYMGFEKNCGKSAAMGAGFAAVESPLVGYIDADLQTVPEDFEAMMPFVDDYELVAGIRTNRKDTWSKRIQSKIGNAFRRAMTGDKVTDTGCPLKLFHTDVAKRMPIFEGMHRFYPALVLLQNGKIKEIPVHHYPRVAGISKYSLWNRLVGPLKDCFGYRWMRKRWYNYNVNSSNLQD